MAKEKTLIKVEDSDLKEMIVSYKNVHDDSNLIKEKSESLSKSIKERLEKKWIELYKETGKNPGTIIIEAIDDFDGSSATISYIPSNRFKSVTDKNLESIVSIIGEDYLDKEVEYSISEKIYKKYESLINDFILNNDEISSSDKLGFIKKTEKFSIKKETINELTDFDSFEKVFETISPVFSIKDPNF